ncbi:MAG: hypothetical protein CL439_07765 [Acidimicrobiaceae bacterium]|nr:hypothetical protein [Acidimicrobiaceae bacterium]
MSIDQRILTLMRATALAESLPVGRSIDCPISILTLNGDVLALNDQLSDLLKMETPTGHWTTRCPNAATQRVKQSFDDAIQFGVSTITRPIISSDGKMHLIRPTKQLIDIGHNAFIFDSIDILAKNIDSVTPRTYSFPRSIRDSAPKSL